MRVKIIMVLMSIIALVMISGCGGDVTTGDTTNWSKKNTLSNCEGKTSLGFYGSEVSIGNGSGLQYLKMEKENTQGRVIMEITDHGDLMFITDTTGGSTVYLQADYGVSADASTIKLDLYSDGDLDAIIKLKKEIASNIYDATMSNVHTGKSVNVTLSAAGDPW